MKRNFFYITCIAILMVISCRDETISVFEKTADERSAEAIALLKADLVAPANGWRVKYNPEPESGSFYVLMDFNEDYTLNIKTDLATDDNEFLEQTITYRIDNSLGVELIFENYSFFSYLFEQNQATFGAEFEFNYVGKTNNTLLFESKTDITDPTQLTLEQAGETDIALLGSRVSKDIQTLSGDLDIFSSSLKITYTTKDLIFYLSLNDFERTINIHSASKKSNTETIQAVNFSSPYLITGDSIIFNNRLNGTFLGNAININGLKLNNIKESSILLCAEPIPIHNLEGLTSSGDAIALEPSLIAANGSNFTKESTFYSTPLLYIYNNGISAQDEIAQNITGAVQMQLYYNYNLGDGTVLNAIGFYIENADGTTTFALREFTAVFNSNNMVFEFAPDFTIFNSETTDANIENINIYLDALTQGNNTYVFKFSEGIYEFNNPCTGWSFVFLSAN